MILALIVLPVLVNAGHPQDTTKRRKLQNGVTFLHVVTSGTCMSAIFDNANPQTNNAEKFQSQQSTCSSISSALGGTGSYGGSRSSRRKAGKGCWWKDSSSGDLSYNSKSTTKSCSNSVRCLCLQPCNAGTFGIYTQEQCQTCADGQAAPAVGAIGSCTDCQLGKYQDGATPSACQDCAVGKYSDQLGLPNCKSCSAGFHNDQEGSSSSGDCKPCFVGLYEDQEASTTCKGTFLLPTLIFLYMSRNVYRFFILIFFSMPPSVLFFVVFCFLHRCSPSTVKAASLDSTPIFHSSWPAKPA